MNCIMSKVIWFVVLVGYSHALSSRACNRPQEACDLGAFPENFKFGTASSAYQVEGAYLDDGKGRSWWDWFLNTYASNNGNNASNSYYYYLDDVAALEAMGVDYYRFSISWTRILPKGFRNEINQAGVNYYNNILDALEKAGIEPFVTIFHWDTPYTLTHLGDWSNPRIVDYFVEYADLLFQLYGDRVKLWGTINEPRSFCQEVPESAYHLEFLPEIPLGTYEYLCGHHALLAHAYTYKLYQDKYKFSQRGRVGIVLNLDDNIPYSNSTEDIAVADRANAFDIGWFADPIFYGDYPQILKDIVATNSALQNLSQSRLPEFTINQKNVLKGSYDLLFLNHYSAQLVSLGNLSEYDSTVSWTSDKQVTSSLHETWNTTNIGFVVHHPSIRSVLTYIKNTYNNPEIWISENGYSNVGGVTDSDRIDFIHNNLEQVRLAMCEDEVKVVGYTYWSLLDSFEWNSMYTAKFGLVEVNFTTYTRTLKESAYYYRNLISSRLINSTSSPNPL